MTDLNALHEAAEWRNHQLAIECADDYLTDNEQTLALYALDLEERVASHRKHVADATLVPATKYDALVEAAEAVVELWMRGTVKAVGEQGRRDLVTMRAALAALKEARP